MDNYFPATQRPLFLVGARRRNSTLYFTSTTPRTSPKTARTEINVLIEENFEQAKNPRTRRPIKIKTSRTTIGTTTARPPSTRVTKYGRRKVNSSGTTKPVESQAPVIRSTPPTRVNSRFKFVSRKPTFIRTRPQPKANQTVLLNPDQHLESSNQQSLEDEIRNSLETTDLTDVVQALQKIQKIPFTTEKPAFKPKQTSTILKRIKQTTPKPTETNFDKINEESEVKIISEPTPTTSRITVSTFRGTLKPKLTFKQTPVYQELLNSQEEERESNTKSSRTRTPKVQSNNRKQPAFKETTNFNFKESKPSISYKGQEKVKVTNLEEHRPEYFMETTGFSKSSTPKSNLILNEVPLIIPVISSSYLKKSNTKNNNEYNLVYQNTNLDPFKAFEDFGFVTPPPTNNDNTYKELSINIPIVAPSSTGYFRSTTSRPIKSSSEPFRGSSVASAVQFRSSTSRPFRDQVTAGPIIVDDGERQITQAYVQKYSSPNVTPTKRRFRYSTTEPPLILVTPTPGRVKIQRKQGRPAIQAFDKIVQPAEANTFKPLAEYDYYDDLEASILGQIPDHGKVLLHGNGVIECLDQGNFPHPVSCKKFIQCAKMENGKVYGWEYTCPKNLSFDPIGGMCNWSAGLGCNE